MLIIRDPLRDKFYQLDKWHCKQSGKDFIASRGWFSVINRLYDDGHIPVFDVHPPVNIFEMVHLILFNPEPTLFYKEKYEAQSNSQRR